MLASRDAKRALLASSWDISRWLTRVAGGTKTGWFEYTLGAKEDGPTKPDGKLVIKVIATE